MSPYVRKLCSRRIRSFLFSRGQDGFTFDFNKPFYTGFKKLTLVEDDVGVLWIESAQLVYKGDTENFELKRDNVISVECKADAGSMASYAGAVYPILRYRNTDGSESSIRFHAWGNWTLGGMSKSLKLLSLKLEYWHNILSSGIGS